MTARKLSIILSIVGALMFIGGTIYFIIGYVNCKNQIVGIEDAEQVTNIVQPFISNMLIWVLGNFLIATFVNGVAAMSYAMSFTYFKGDALFIVKIIVVFIPLVMCGVYFLITKSLMP
ncbi:hypothetical protein EI71_01203 [Anaeroplasma bactoclasticum]|uniref:Uncharacterized protein n=1 Tax=Anaeroplasma bactoclasticum TaxID=2088 RepID=A0A397RVR5_9MOLU|nr:hypothetical protein [Anaeroplasma bactoclasticum]RIA75717.1 hypothetical protein EI71_01203 [Anaeroplasma bactoclasticum]